MSKFLKQNPKKIEKSEIPNNEENRNNIIEQKVEEEIPYQEEEMNFIDHSSLIKDNLIWKCFPLSERLNYSIRKFIKMRKNKFSFVDYLEGVRTIDFSPGEARLFDEHVIVLKINETSNLELDPRVLHPFVKIHIVDIRNGLYLKKSSMRPFLTEKESCSVYYKKTKEFLPREMINIAPFSTKFCDLRVIGNSKAKWNEGLIFFILEIFLDIPGSILLNPNSLILFEILDFNTRLIKDKKFNLLDSNYMYRVGWSYLRPNGLSGKHFGPLKLQLYTYKFKSQTGNYLSITGNIPHVYFDFIWPFKVLPLLNQTEYNGTLNIEIQTIIRPNYNYVQTQPKNIFEVLKIEDSQYFNAPLKENAEEEYISESMKLYLRRKRFPDEECKTPDSILYKFQTEGLGCYRLKFSPNGQYLAACVTLENSKTIVQIYDLNEGKLSATLKAHNNIIHSLSWSLDSQYLLTGSSDFQVKLWKINLSNDNYFDEDISLQKCFSGEMNHPSYVYAVEFLPEKHFYKKCIFVTACFDSKIRIFSFDLDREGKALKKEIIGEMIISKEPNELEEFDTIITHRHPTCIVFDEGLRLYVGDSLGCIHIFDIQMQYSKVNITKTRFINIEELDGEIINKIFIHTGEFSEIIVHSRDNCIRGISLSSYEPKVIRRFYGAKSSKKNIQSILSPDQQFLCSGSEDGKIYIWDFNYSMLQDTNYFEVGFEDPVTDVDWNKSFHMIAVCGFGNNYPILVYNWERPESISILDLKNLLEKHKIIEIQEDHYQAHDNNLDEDFDKETFETGKDYFPDYKVNENKGKREKRGSILRRK